MFVLNITESTKNPNTIGRDEVVVLALTGGQAATLHRLLCEAEKRPIALNIDDQTRLQFVRRKLREARLATM